MIEFTPYPKTPRLFRQCFITEKIDGMNAAINIVEGAHFGGIISLNATGSHTVCAQSRKCLITPKDDKFGFAKWVHDNAETLVDMLGPGIHFGEWWGSGVRRDYGLLKGEKRFSLFNVGRWNYAHGKTPLDPEKASEIGLGTVPVLYSGIFSLPSITWATNFLRTGGSVASPGFNKPEGIIVYHVDAGQAFKVLLENDDISKTEAGAT